MIVAFPIFIFLHTLIGRELQRRPDLYESGIRRWLTYLALVIAAIMVLSNAVWFGLLVRSFKARSRYDLSSIRWRCSYLGAAFLSTT